MNPLHLVVLFIVLGIAVLPALALSKIANKAGLSGWIGLTQLLPLINMAGLLYVAYTEWPNKEAAAS